MQEHPLNKSIEEQTRLDIINMNLRDAIDLIVDRGLVYHILQEDKKIFDRTDPCYISHRINLILRHGRVVNTEVY